MLRRSLALWLRLRASGCLRRPLARASVASRRDVAGSVAGSAAGSVARTVAGAPRRAGGLPPHMTHGDPADVRRLVRALVPGLPDGVEAGVALAAVHAAAARRPQEGDAARLALSEELRASRGLPTALGPVRRCRLLAWDQVGVTWEGWHTATGRRVLLRALRPEFAQDPTWLRRLDSATSTVAALVAAGAPLAPLEPLEGWPGVVAEGALRLDDLLPAEDPVDRAGLARLLTAGLRGLEALDGAGWSHGCLRPHHILLGDDPRLVWLDTPGGPGQDLAALGRALAELAGEPSAEGHADGVAAFVHTLAEDPPPTVADAVALLRSTLARELTAARHEVALKGRLLSRRSAGSELLGLVRRLAGSLTPPRGRWCLRAGRDGVLVLVDVASHCVRGGPAADAATPFLPRLWSPERGLDAAAARVVLRAWSTRATGDETRRGAVQAALGADDAGADAACRWLGGQARLRTTALVLERSGQAAA